jgi:hypothetical protein
MLDCCCCCCCCCCHFMNCWNCITISETRCCCDWPWCWSWLRGRGEDASLERTLLPWLVIRSFTVLLMSLALFSGAAAAAALAIFFDLASFRY